MSPARHPILLVAKSVTLMLLLSVIAARADDGLFLTEQQAREELKLVVDAIREHHPSPYHASTEEQFEREVKALEQRKGRVPVVRQYFDLMKISSLVFDTHTQFHITGETPGFEVSFPLRFRLFPDGLYIIAGDNGYRDAIGKKVVAVGGTPTMDIVERLSHHSPADNWPRKRVFAEIFFYMPETYEYLGLTGADGAVELELISSDGTPSKLQLSHTWDKGYADFSWDTQNPFIPTGLVTVHQALDGQLPFYLQSLDNNYWYQFLDAEKKYLYLQINQQFDKSEGQAAIEFHLEWARQLLDANTEVMIVDLRNDPGGTVNVANPLPALLSEIYFDHPTMRGVAVLFGTDTVSAGTIILGQFEDTIRPVFIGQPSGSSPNMYLNGLKQILPYSQLQFEVSSDVFVSTREADTRAYVAPDIPMALSFEDYLRGNDPLIDYAKTINKELRSNIYKSASPYDPWQRESQKEALR
ncbi:MAG: hypothetical protein ABJ308_10205 [Halieaceae bacterium]